MKKGLFLLVIVVISFSGYYLYMGIEKSELTVNYDDFMVAYKQSDSYPESEEYRNAVEIYLKQIEKSPEDAAVFHQLGDIYMMAGENEKAIEVFKQALEFEPKSYSINHSLSGAYIKTKDYEKALTYSQKAIQLNPEDSHAYVFEAICYHYLGMKEKSNNSYLKATQLNPRGKDAFGYIFFSAIDESIDKDDIFIKTWQKNIELDPDDIESYLLLATKYSLSGDYQNAIEAYEGALTINDDEPRAHIGVLENSLFAGQPLVESSINYFQEYFDTPVHAYLDALTLFEKLHQESRYLSNSEKEAFQQKYPENNLSEWPWYEVEDWMKVQSSNEYLLDALAFFQGRND